MPDFCPEGCYWACEHREPSSTIVDRLELEATDALHAAAEATWTSRLPEAAKRVLERQRRRATPELLAAADDYWGAEQWTMRGPFGGTFERLLD